VQLSDEIGDSWGRFFCHWGAATFGFFLRGLLPVLKDWQDPSHIVNYPRWWAVFVYGGVICLVGAGFNCNLPAKPRELLKSVGLEHDLALCGQLPDEHARQNEELERDATLDNDSIRSHPALGFALDAASVLAKIGPA